MQNDLGDIMWDFEKLIDDIENEEISTARRRAREIKIQMYQLKKNLDKLEVMESENKECK